jgi:hypothetical protein
MGGQCGKSTGGLHPRQAASAIAEYRTFQSRTKAALAGLQLTFARAAAIGYDTGGEERRAGNQSWLSGSEAVAA